LKILFFVATLWYTTITCFSQEGTHSQTLYWLRYQNQLIFSPKLHWNNEFDNRRFIDPDVQNQFIFHSRVHYRTGKWDLASGITSSWAFASIPENGYDNSVNELRPVVEASYEHPFKNFFLQGRFRTDFRFFQQDHNVSVLEESDFVMRVRGRIQARIPVVVTEEGLTRISVRLADEIMFNHEENTYDQNRIYATGEFLINKKLSLEAGYLYIHQQRFGREDFFERHVLRFSILHKITL
jgi:hypothetical protein